MAQVKRMSAESSDQGGSTRLESAHVCTQCEFSISLENLGLRGGKTGFLTCPKCDWSEPVNIQIVDGSRASANRTVMCEVTA